MRKECYHLRENIGNLELGDRLESFFLSELFEVWNVLLMQVSLKKIICRIGNWKLNFFHNRDTISFCVSLVTVYIVEKNS